MGRHPDATLSTGGGLDGCGAAGVVAAGGVYVAVCAYSAGVVGASAFGDEFGFGGATGGTSDCALDGGGADVVVSAGGGDAGVGEATGGVVQPDAA